MSSKLKQIHVAHFPSQGGQQASTQHNNKQKSCMSSISSYLQAAPPFFQTMLQEISDDFLKPGNIEALLRVSEIQDIWVKKE